MCQIFASVCQFMETAQRYSLRRCCANVICRCRAPARSPSGALLPTFLREGSPTKLDYREKGPLLQTSPLEDLVLLGQDALPASPKPGLSSVGLSNKPSNNPPVFALPWRHDAASPGASQRQTCLGQMAVGQNQWYHFGVGAPPILVYFSGVAMCTGGTGF